MQEIAEEVALAEDANRRVREENEALRLQLEQVQEQLQAMQAQPSPAASPEVALVSRCRALRTIASGACITLTHIKHPTMLVCMASHLRDAETPYQPKMSAF